MRIQYVDRTCIGITSEEGVVIVIDPVEVGGFAGPGDEARLWADIAVMTHAEDKQAGLKSLKGDPIQISGACQHEIKGITIRGVKCPSPQQEEVGTPAVTVFKFDIDGLRLLHLGPLGHVPGADFKKEIGAVDLLFVPVGGYGTLSGAQAGDAVDRFEPRVVIPLHRPGGMIGFEAESVDTFLQGKKGIKRLPSMTEVSRHSMPSSREIWVLSLK
jgi:L-ascorbate metabolism protein UlaG (beta-lactamase superfamily)